MAAQWFEHLAHTLSQNGIVAYIWDIGDDHLEWAGNTGAFFGLNREDCPSNNAQFSRMLNPADVPGRLAAIHNLLGQGDDQLQERGPSFSTSYKLKLENGIHVEIEESATLQVDREGRRTVCGFLRQQNDGGALVDTASVSGSEKIDMSILHGNGYINQGRVLFQQKIEEWYDNPASQQVSYGYVLVVGIDRMSLFNDVMGTRYADEIIQKTGERLKQIIGEAGYAMRVDGDVYGLFFKQAPHNEMAAVAKYILNNFYNVPIQTSMGPIGVGISIGGMVLDRRQERNAILARAEMAMRVAKDKGRSCFVSYDEASSNAEDNKALLRSADNFLKALKENRLRFAFQPVMGASAESVSFHECLIRMIDEAGQMIAAASFIPAIEKLGLSRLMDQYALRMAVHELTMFPDIRLSVNISNLSLTDKDWLRNLVSSLRDRPSVAQRLIIEITESAVIHDMEKTKRVVRTLQDLGCSVALDDFGAGYTAFSQLKELNVDIVKIDKSFIRNIDDENNHLFVRTLKSLADGVNVQTVGEGAETLAEAQLLARDGIDHIQGYVYGFPRVERLWLPKDHVYRNISTEVAREARQGLLEDSTIMNDEILKKKLSG